MNFCVIVRRTAMAPLVSNETIAPSHLGGVCARVSRLTSWSFCGTFRRTNARNFSIGQQANITPPTYSPIYLFISHYASGCRPPTNAFWPTGGQIVLPSVRFQWPGERRAESCLEGISTNKLRGRRVLFRGPLPAVQRPPPRRRGALMNLEGRNMGGCPTGIPKGLLSNNLGMTNRPTDRPTVFLQMLRRPTAKAGKQRAQSRGSFLASETFLKKTSPTSA
jgi:hypothetical protein